MVRYKTDFTNIKCCICEKDLLKDSHPYREYDKEGNWTGKWLCVNCHGKEDRKNNPNNLDNKKKLLRNCRTGNQNPNSNTAKGDKFEELTCRWMGVKNLNKENDNYSAGTPIDHSPDSEGKIFQTAGRLYSSRNGRWNFSSLEREWKKKFDYMICYCASKDGKMIERIYKIPKSEIINIKGITIVKNPSRGGWYEKYRVTDKDAIKKVNEIWKEILVAYA